MNDKMEILAKLISDEEWHVNYYTDKLAEAKNKKEIYEASYNELKKTANHAKKQ